MIRTLSTVGVALLVSFRVGAILTDLVGPSGIIGLLTLLIAAALIRWPSVLIGAASLMLLGTIPGILEAVVLAGILLVAFVLVTWLRSLSPDLPATHPRRTTRHDLTTTDHTAGAGEYDPDALDLDTASVFTSCDPTNTHTTPDAGTTFDWQAYADHLVRTYYQEHSPEEIRSHRFAPREIKGQLYTRMAQQTGAVLTPGERMFLTDLANSTWVDFREREPPPETEAEPTLGT